MADEHFWDNGVAQRSTALDYKLRYTDLDGNVTDTIMATLERSCDVFEKLKAGRKVAKCELIHVENGVETVQQKFEFQVMDINGTKVVI